MQPAGLFTFMSLLLRSWHLVVYLFSKGNFLHFSNVASLKVSFRLILAEWINDCSVRYYRGNSNWQYLKNKIFKTDWQFSEEICWLPHARITGLSLLLIVVCNVFLGSQDISLTHWNETVPNIYPTNNTTDDSCLYSDLSWEKYQKLSSHYASTKQKMYKRFHFFQPS